MVFWFDLIFWVFLGVTELLVLNFLIFYTKGKQFWGYLPLSWVAIPIPIPWEGKNLGEILEVAW